MKEVTFRLEVFEGPLDLLLHLVETALPINGAGNFRAHRQSAAAIGSTNQREC